jgi:hypothetical protein
MKHSAIDLTALTICALLSCNASSQVATSTQNIGQGQAGPSLAETIAFMNRSVSQESSYVTSANTCEVSILRNHLYVFVLPSSTYVKSVDSYGASHYGFKWDTIEEKYQLIQFQLSDIDPDSIKSKAVPSEQFIKSRDIDANPKELDSPDLVMVMFNTRNSENLIQRGGLKKTVDGQSLEANFEQKINFSFIVFESKDRAERFVTAFKHATKLCGGKSSDFAPTPSIR